MFQHKEEQERWCILGKLHTLFNQKNIDILIKYQKYLLGLAIFLALTAVSFTVQKGEVKSIFQNYPVLMLFLIAISIFLVLIYISIDKEKINTLSTQIKTSASNTEDIDILLKELTPRQKEVYDLILSGKSNKQILADLYIEQSTLKTHINQIYKKLKVQNRKELKSKKTPFTEP